MPQRSQAVRIKPPALHAGDTIGIVAPASSFNRDDFDTGCEALRKLGYRIVYDESSFGHDLYFAGSAERRARELEQMFLRDDVKAIVCARGGYGANYLLPRLAVERIAAHPKIFVGYSDVTSLLTYLCDAANCVMFHGPMVAKDFAKADGVDFATWQSALSGQPDWRLSFDSASGVDSLVQGAAEGLLYGGCLSMLVASLGTPYEIRTGGTVLFIEDIGARPYQIDRMLMQLKLAGKFAGVKAIIFGEMLDCGQSPTQQYSLQEVVMRIVGDLGIPVAYGVRSGHVSKQNITLPIGVQVRVEIESSGLNIEFLEPTTAA